MKKITENGTIAEILKIPGTEEILAKYNIPCLHCPMAQFEIENLKIGDVCQVYKIDIEKLLKELNKFSSFSFSHLTKKRGAKGRIKK